MLTETNHWKSDEVPVSTKLFGQYGLDVARSICWSVQFLTAECPSPYTITVPFPCTTAGSSHHSVGVCLVGSTTNYPSSMPIMLSSMKTQVLAGPGVVMLDSLG